MLNPAEVDRPRHIRFMARRIRRRDFLPERNPDCTHCLRCSNLSVEGNSNGAGKDVSAERHSNYSGACTRSHHSCTLHITSIVR